MSIKKSSYDGMEWVNALKARKEPLDYEAQLANATEESLDNVVERTVQAAFSLPTTEETSEQAMKRASKSIQEQHSADLLKAHVDAIRGKLAERNIDPVALGVAKEEDWKGSLDPQWVEKTAKLAAVAFQKKMSAAWQDGVLEPKQQGQKYDPATSRDGRIMSTAAAGEDSHGPVSRNPKNSNSIFDPFKLDRFAAEETEHDKSVQSKRAQDKARAEKVAQDRAAAIQSLPTEQQMNHGKITSAGQAVPEVFSPKSPRNQISMTDDLTKKISDLFTRVDDNKSKTIAAQQARREEIQGKKEVDKSWEKVSKQSSTGDKMSDLKERLKDLWTTEESAE